MIETQDVYAELREKKADLLTMFASPGWALLNRWLNEQILVRRDRAYAGDTQEIRDEARVEGHAIEHVINLAVYLADHAGLNGAEGASLDSPKTTPEAQ